MKIIIATVKYWNIRNVELFKKQYPEHNIMVIDTKEEFVIETISVFSPDYIFFPHWSWKIPQEVFSKYRCVVFHMTDLPFGRGGSPLQNLIYRGFEKTKISAIEVSEEMDEGRVYLKEDLGLNGTAREIYIRASEIIFFKMMVKLIDNPKIEPIDQKGEVVVFNRRTKEDSKLDENMSLKQVYNHIRMLDADGYPQAYIEFGRLKLSFKRGSYHGNKIIADVIIEENENE